MHGFHRYIAGRYIAAHILLTLQRSRRGNLFDFHRVLSFESAFGSRYSGRQNQSNDSHTIELNWLEANVHHFLCGWRGRVS